MSKGVIKKSLGGDRLGSGKKMDLALHNFERSSHNLGRMWKSTMAPGVLTPCLVELALNGDTWEIDLAAAIKTQPAILPLYGSFKFQVDAFACPVRLYIKELHNNALNIGRNMDKVFFPIMTAQGPNPAMYPDTKNKQVSQSSLLAYTGTRGIGRRTNTTGNDIVKRKINATPIIAYYDIFKNYYANKQEKKAYYIGPRTTTYTSQITYVTVELSGSTISSTVEPDEGMLVNPKYIQMSPGAKITLQGSNMATDFESLRIAISSTQSGNVAWISINKFMNTTSISENYITGVVTASHENHYLRGARGGRIVQADRGMQLYPFDLENIDKMRDALLTAQSGVPFEADKVTYAPYNQLTALSTVEGYENYSNSKFPMMGLCVKTYQSDMYNNWLNEEWIEGTNGIAEVTAVDTSDGSFTIDSLILAKKVYNMLNRIAVSDGSYNAWQEAVYGQSPRSYESPVYLGGMSGGISFDEVVQTVETEETPLGTLAGRGSKGNQYNGRKIKFKAQEPCFLIVIASITPRIDYSQGNKWFNTQLFTLDDMHKPNLDGIGFQDAVTDQIAAWDTIVDGSGNVAENGWHSYGKIPAWLNYMTTVSETFGDFAVDGDLRGMTLMREYEADQASLGNTSKSAILDMTTYIDPQKFNYPFADQNLSAQNFWVFIAMDIVARRKMSAKVMPNL